MSYLTLLLTGLLPPTALLLARRRRHGAAPAVPAGQQAAALGVLVVLAVATTLPWDAALLARGTWSYPRAHLVGHVAGVPVEELLFMLLQPVLVAAWCRGLRPSAVPTPVPVARPSGGRTARAAGAVAGSGAALVGLGVAGTAHGTYLGWLLAWAGPLLALQWAVGGDRLWSARRLLLVGAGVPALYLCALDRLALGLHLWQLSPARTTGAAVAGLPLEEGLFFALTSLLVVGGLLLALDRPTRDRLRRAAPGRGTAAPAAPRPAPRRRAPARPHHPSPRRRTARGRAAARR